MKLIRNVREEKLKKIFFNHAFYDLDPNAGHALYYISGLIIFDVLSLAACFPIFEKEILIPME